MPATTHTTSIDWDRVLALDPLIQRLGQYHARRLERPHDGEELAARIRQAIVDRAAGDPDFLRQTDNFIITFGSWRMLNSLRPEWALVPLGEPSPTVPFLDRLDVLSIRQALRNLDPELQDLVRDILENDGILIKRNGRLNVAALCQATGRTRKRVRTQLARLRTKLGGMER